MYNLLGHMHLHAGSKPFKCPYCSSKFNLKGNLSRHMKVKHGVMDISLDSQGGSLGWAGLCCGACSRFVSSHPSCGSWAVLGPRGAAGASPPHRSMTVCPCADS